MGGASDDQASKTFPATIHVGDLCSGTATEVTRSHGVAVTLDGFSARPLGTVGPLELSWRQYPAAAVEVGAAPEDVVRTGDEITVVVTEIDRERRRLVLSRRQVSPDLR
jgi:ribosomal protein S1